MAKFTNYEQYGYNVVETERYLTIYVHEGAYINLDKHNNITANFLDKKRIEITGEGFASIRGTVLGLDELAEYTIDIYDKVTLDVYATYKTLSLFDNSAAELINYKKGITMLYDKSKVDSQSIIDNVLIYNNAKFTNKYSVGTIEMYDNTIVLNKGNIDDLYMYDNSELINMDVVDQLYHFDNAVINNQSVINKKHRKKKVM